MDDLLQAFELSNYRLVKTLLKRNQPPLDLSHPSSHGWTLLHRCSIRGISDIMILLLLRRDIDVNQKDDYGMTPLHLACSEGETECVKLLLKDERVETQARAFDGATPLWYAALWGYLDIIQWFIVAGKPLGLHRMGYHGQEYSVLDIARKSGRSLVIELLERYQRDPAKTRGEVILDFGLVDQLVAECFAILVFLCDGFLRVKEKEEPGLTPGEEVKVKREGETPPATRRFFEITMKLPMELQMLVCNRVYRSPKVHVLSKDSEPAFKGVARQLLLDGAI